MGQMTPEVSKLLEQALSLSVEEQGRWRIPRFSTSVARWVREYKRPGKPRSGSNRRTGIRRGTNHFLGGSASAHLGEAASCPPVFRSFMMKPPPNMMRHSTGTWRAAPMAHSSSTPKWIGRSPRSCKLPSVGRLPRARLAGSCSDNFLITPIYREQTSADIQIVAVAHTSRNPGYRKRRR